LAPESFTTLPHFSVSSAISLLKSAGEPVIALPPKSPSRAFIFGSARATLISLLSLGLLGIASFVEAPAIHRPSLVSNFIQTPLSQRAHPSGIKPPSGRA
jgi:hypothetical protein